MSDIQCVVVTPEKTEIDVLVSSVTVPLFDGEMGILKGHSPLVGRLGYGVLRMVVDGAPERYFVEGGFVQVANNVVSVLTDKVVPMSEVTSAIASAALEAALSLPAEAPDQIAARQKACQRARAMQRCAD
ncbi:MAG: ATP synthase F1 subunit epsilon [Planctomycetales bacterium]|nr:ATP synthase F1 subunit epsilon [Planctomycetales bacterium]